MTLICAAQFVLQLDFSIVNVALPTIQRDLGMPAAQLQWIVTGYALTFGSLLLAGGRLADLLGRRRLLVAGLVLFALASVACGLAEWPVMLIIARIVQGAAGAMISPAALSLLTTTNPEGPARDRALAIWQATTAAAARLPRLPAGTRPPAARAGCAARRGAAPQVLRPRRPPPGRPRARHRMICRAQRRRHDGDAGPDRGSGRFPPGRVHQPGRTANRARRGGRDRGRRAADLAP
jgi:hypothetical protein